MKRKGAFVALCILSAERASAEGSGADSRVPDVPEPAYPWKLTVGDYDYGSYSGRDVNLRHRADGTSIWVGWYRDRDFGEQWRAGWDTALAVVKGSSLSVLPSIQVASHGFVGGSLALQYGAPWFVQGGIGRTNLRPYANLNFDPNDSLSISAGYQPDAGAAYGVALVADDRLGTGQRDLHATGRWPLPEGRHLTIDLLHKQGQGDSGYVRAWGATVNYDFRRWFVRLARDPKQNFGRVDATRLSAGYRF